MIPKTRVFKGKINQHSHHIWGGNIVCVGSYAKFRQNSCPFPNHLDVTQHQATNPGKQALFAPLQTIGLALGNL